MLLDLLQNSDMNALHQTEQALECLRFSTDSIKKIEEVFSLLKDDKDVGHLTTGIELTSDGVGTFGRSKIETLFSADPFQINDLLGPDDNTSHLRYAATVQIGNFSITDVMRESSNNSRHCVDQPVIVNTNVDENLKRIPPYFLNQSSMINVVGRSDSLIYEMISIGINGTLFALVMKNKTLRIRWPVLKSLLDTHPIGRIAKVLKATLLRYREFRDQENLLNPLDASYLSKSIQQRLTREYDVEKLSDDRLKNLIGNALYDINKKLKSSSFGRDMTIYAKIFKGMADRARRSQQHEIQNAFNNGLKLSTKLAILGWKPSDDKLSANDIWFEKEVNIIPKIMIWEGIHYSIPEKECKFEITKLYLGMKGTMRCKGNHPNVSGGGVCMGDLGDIKFSLPEKELSDAIERAARLLEIINYDSPFDASGRARLLEVSTKMQTGELKTSKIKSKSISSKSTIRRISMNITSEESNSDDELEKLLDPDSEETPDTSEVTIVDNSTPSTGDQVLFDALTEIDRQRHTIADNLADNDGEGGKIIIIFKIADTDRHISMHVPNSLWDSYSHDLLENDIRIAHHRMKSSNPVAITQTDFNRLCKYLTPVFIKYKGKGLLADNIKKIKRFFPDSEWESIRNKMINFHTSVGVK